MESLRIELVTSSTEDSALTNCATHLLLVIITATSKGTKNFYKIPSSHLGL